MSASAHNDVRNALALGIATLLIVVGLLVPVSPAQAATSCTNYDCTYGPQWMAAKDVSYWGQTAGHNCTNYVAWRLSSANIPKFTGSGSAHAWGSFAESADFDISDTPVVRSIAWWDSYRGTMGSDGHVAIVEAVSGGTITVSEDGYYSQQFRWRTYGASEPSGYIIVPGFTGSGSGSTTVLAPGDWDGDGFNDVLHIRPSGLYLYRGNGSGGFINPSGGTLIGASWNSFKKVLAPGDWDGDGHPDLLAIQNDGSLWLYRGNGSGGFAQSNGILIGTSWHSFKDVIAPGDFSGDGNPDLMAVAANGALNLYPGNGTGGFLASSVIGAGWSGFTKLVTPGDWNGDGDVDVLGVVANGDMYRYTGNGAGGWATTSVLIGTGWTFREVTGTADLGGNGTSDVLAVTNGGALYLYGGNGVGGFGSGVLIGASGW